MSTDYVVVDESGNDITLEVSQSATVAVQVNIGPEGLRGSLWRFGTGAPSNSLGNDGDCYLDTATGNVYLKVSGSYVLQGTISGGGGGGSTWHIQAGAPTIGVGVDGDFYLNTTTGDVYKKVSGSWGSPLTTIQMAGNYITGLTGDVSASGPGSVSATVNTVGGSSAANIHTAEQVVNTAQSGNKVLASPASGSSGTPGFRAIVAADIPTLNQNTTGTASNVTGTVAIGNGGTGQITRQAAIDALTGTQSSGTFLRSDGTHATLSAIQTADVPTLNQNTTGNAATATAPATGSAHGAATLDSSGHFQSVAPGTAGNYLRSNGTDYVQSTIQAADVPTLNQNTTGTASNITASSNTSLTSLANLATVGTVTTGTWNGTAVDSTHGGTAQTSYTTGDTLYASGTNTLSKRAIGNAGQVSRVISGVPTWDDFVNISNYAIINEDFLTSSTQGQSAWSTSGTGTGSGISTVIDPVTGGANPGVLRLAMGTTTTGTAGISSNASTKIFNLSNGTIYHETIIRLGTLSNGTDTYAVQVGMTDQAGTFPDANNGVYFKYSNGINSGNWACVCANSATTTTINTSVAAITTGFVRLGWVYTPGSGVQFFIGGVSQGTTTTNLPTANLNYVATTTKSAGTTGLFVYVDAIKLMWTLTTPR